MGIMCLWYVAKYNFITDIYNSIEKVLRMVEFFKEYVLPTLLKK